jgi:antitoxin CcdA
MGHDRAAPKRPVNMTLNEDLVRRVRRITPNLSETVERLLTEFVDDAEARAANRQRQIDDHVRASDAFIAKYGSVADEFNTIL